MKRIPSTRLSILGATALALPLVVAPLSAQAVWPATPSAPVRVNVSSAQTQTDGPTTVPTINGNGRFSGFGSEASNLVPGDTNGVQDEFVRDTWLRRTIRASVASDGTQANGWSGMGQLSADGMHVAFASDATNLWAGDTNGQRDIVVRDLLTHRTQRIAVGDHPYISGDGRYVGYDTCIGGWYFEIDGCGVYLRDRRTGRTERIDVSSAEVPATTSSMAGRLSLDGRFMTFVSAAPNLAPGATNGVGQLYVRDRYRGTTELVSTSTAKGPGNGTSADASFSANGRYVAFWSYADNLVAGDVNGDGDPAGFPCCRPGADIFVRDRWTGTTQLVSVSTAGVQSNAWTGHATISGDGRFVVFHTEATNWGYPLAEPCHYRNCEPRMVFLRDRATHATRLISRTASGALANDFAGYPSISVDGRSVSFMSFATNLVAGDTNGQPDAFVVRLPGYGRCRQ